MISRAGDSNEHESLEDARNYGRAHLRDPAGVAGTPQVQKYETVEYLTGGVGIDDVDAMHAVVKDYNLILQFAAKHSGAFVADVDVNVRNRGGKTLLAAKSNGPCLFAGMPPGQYKVSADFEGKLQENNANVGAKRSELYFY